MLPKSQQIGYQPEVILAGRKLNDSMGSYIASKFVKALIKKDILIEGANILIMGLAFKENCHDIRNTRVEEIYRDLVEYKCNIDIYDPLVDKYDALEEYNIRLILEVRKNFYDGIILAVSHDQFKNLGSEEIRSYCKKKHIFFDIKAVFDQSKSDFRL